MEPTDMDRDLRGRNALVIGGTRGIGLAVAEKLACRGATLTVSYLHDATAAEEAVKRLASLGADVEAIRADAADPAATEYLFQTAAARLDRLDVVVHIAGRMVKSPLAQTTPAEYALAMDCNARSSFLALTEASRRIAAHGRIVLVSSTLTDVTMGGYGVYSASKAAVEQLVKAAACELGSRGVTVNAVSPGPVDTPFLREHETAESLAYAAGAVPARRLGRPDDVAPLVSFLTGEEARWVNGQTIRVNGGMY